MERNSFNDFYNLYKQILVASQLKKCFVRQFVSTIENKNLVMRRDKRI
jgi:hypothetical protein